EAAGRAVRETDHAGGDGGEALAGLAVDAVGHGERQAVGRHHHRLADGRDLLDEPSDEPVEVCGSSVHRRSPSRSAWWSAWWWSAWWSWWWSASLRSAWSSPDGASGVVRSGRPLRNSVWNARRRSRSAS